MPSRDEAAPGTCQEDRNGDEEHILNLVLGPLHLNLLGLDVDLNQVVLNITAVPGAGNLLGNLLCGIAGLLDIAAIGPILAGLLNNLTTILAGLGL